jgi:hypothetical protein
VVNLFIFTFNEGHRAVLIARAIGTCFAYFVELVLHFPLSFPSAAMPKNYCQVLNSGAPHFSFIRDAFSEFGTILKKKNDVILAQDFKGNVHGPTEAVATSPENGHRGATGTVAARSKTAQVQVSGSGPAFVKRGGDTKLSN